MTRRRLIWLPGDPPDGEPERTSPLVDLWAAELDAAERHAERYRAMSDAYEGTMGEHHCLKTLTPEEWEQLLRAQSDEAQSDRFQADPWESVLAEWAARSLDHWVPSTALSTTLGIEPQRVDRTIEMRVATCMKRLGWTRERVMHNRVRQWGWRRPTPKGEAAVGQEVGQPIVEQSRQAALPTLPTLPSPKGEGGEDRNRGGVTYPPARKNSLEVLGGGWGEGQEGQRGSKPAESHAEPLPDPAAPLPHAAPMREPGDDSDLIDGDGEEGER